MRRPQTDNHLTATQPGSRVSAYTGRFAPGYLSDVDALRPFECWLTGRDHALLEGHLLRSVDSLLLSRLIRAKLADARLVLSDDVESDIATGNSHIVYSVDGKPDESRVLVHWDHEAMVEYSLPVNTLLGVTLLGMKAGQRAPLMRADGTVGEVFLRQIAFQPEAARRPASGTVMAR